MLNSFHFEQRLNFRISSTNLKSWMFESRLTRGIGIQLGKDTKGTEPARRYNSY